MKSISRILSLVLASVLALTAGCHSSSRSSDGGAPTPAAPATATTPERLWRDDGFGLVAHDEIIDGVYISTDYVYDDHGPNTDGAAGGDSTYPTDGTPYFKNAADLVEVRVMPVESENKLLIGVRFNTLIDPAIPVAAIGIADNSTPQLSESWPFSPGISAKGTRFVITLRGDKTTLTDLSSGKSSEFTTLVFNDQSSTLRNLENTFTAIIPLTELGDLASNSTGEWRLHAASGLWEGNQWAEAPFDIAFFEDTFVNWQQNEQATLLTSGDLSSAQGILKFDDFPFRSPAMSPGRYARVYPSPISSLIGEGIVPWTQQVEGVKIPTLNHYRGLYLPYTIWIPEEIASATQLPLFIYLHGASQNHLGHLQPFVDGIIDVAAIVIAPTGAGELSFYKEAGEVDALSSMNDVTQHYPIDLDRVFLSGLSMGGQGTFSVGTHRPDLFAAALPFIGTGQSTFNEDIPGNTEIIPANRWMNSTGRKMLENALNLPFRMANGALDPIVNLTWPTQDVARMKELQNDHQFLIFHGRHHETIPEYINAVYHQVINGCATAAITAGCVANRDSTGIKRDINPARVRYKVVPYHFAEDIGLRYDGAYWVSGMSVRETPDDVSFGIVDVTSFALADKLKSTIQELSLEPTLVFDPTGDTYSFQGLRREKSGAEIEQRMIADLKNLKAIAFDTRRAGLTPETSPTTIVITSDGITDITLTGLDSNVKARIGNSIVATTNNGQLLLHVSAGETTITLSRH